ncbi:SDR family NAD(P)-dependent oxidoreductase [Sinomicrobium weinanense]|uniref:SDR family NAD(P)-dependent oxidoreductase n=1 Tax=Sinomicrobium weinanense TaxID=2842200 RepID=A0A926JRJ2_9FLAO|nr:SDR family NAD(P)-dependent oxidoreductase [Sinomicrobium weinanense]MBC9795978.1 SDR family NAD(P)-dependent oxidoreductase [Sinomicrobium weinanense]MBU3122097.1 SDR family oxidoreductase [Sinomicrobium weinanense]
MKKTMVIIGAGSGISLSVACLFLSRGFRVALVSRNVVKLKKQISGEGVYFFSADVTDEKDIGRAVTEIRETFNTIDVLHYNAAHIRNVEVFEETTAQLIEDFKVNAAGLLTCAQLFKEDLITSKGAILITGGGIGIYPNPQYASLSAGKAGLRNLAMSLKEALKGTGIYVGTLTINGYVTKGSALYDPDNIALQFWNMYQDGNVFEVRL